MKPLSIWLPLILIVLALLLNVAKSLEPRPIKKPNESPARSKQESQQRESPISNSYGSQTPQEASTAAEQKGDTGKISNGVIVGSAIVSALAALAIGWFNFQLVGVTRELREATEQATRAANKSAEVAELALNIERPYVFIENPKMMIRAEPLPADLPLHMMNIGASIFGPPPPVPLRFEIFYELKNHGKGLAVIDDVRARTHLSRTSRLLKNGAE